MLRKNPGFTAVAVLSLALGIGANTAIFQLLDAVRLKMLPVKAPQEWAEVRIRDTGTGIPESARAKVFDPFFTTKAVGKGTGQGLAIAHNVIVDKHGGTIKVSSAPGQGTTFTIRLPIGGMKSEPDASAEAVA